MYECKLHFNLLFISQNQYYFAYFSSVQLSYSVPFVIIYISFKIYLSFFKIDVKGRSGVYKEK